MKLLVVSSLFPPAWDWGGPVKSMWNLAWGLAGLGVEVTVLATNAKQKGIVDVPAERVEEGVRILTAPVLGGGRWDKANRHGLSPSYWKMIAANIRNADLVHLNGFWGPSPAVTGASCKLFNKPYVLSTRGNLEDRSLSVKTMKKELALKLGVKRLLRGASALHFTTEMERDLSPDWAKRINAIVVPNPIEMPNRTSGHGLREKYGITDGALLLGIVGRLHERKGFDVLLPALAKVAATRDIILLAVGPDEAGYKGELERTISRDGLTGRVIFSSELSGEDLISAYAGMDLLVSPSYGESFGNVIVEATAQGTPCFVSDQVGLKDWVAENDIGLVLPLEPTAWAAALDGLNREDLPRRWDPSRISRLARESFSIEAVAKQMLAHYERILSEQRRN